MPNNYYGTQLPKTGNSYAAIIIYTQPFGHEYLETKLTSILSIGKSYCVRLYISLAETSKFAVSNIGVYFSNDSCLSITPPYTLSLNAQIKNTDTVIVKDKTNWQLISLTYKAIGGERFITIGNFDADNNTHITNVGGTQLNAYYYIDDLSVIELPEIDAGSSDTICNSTAGVQLNASCTGCWAGLKYRWFPNLGLSDTTILNPIANPTQTTTYYFGLVDTTNEIGCFKDVVDSVTVYVGCVGINEFSKNNYLKIYPNPAQSQITIGFEATKPTTIQIKNTLGQTIKTIQNIPTNTKNKIEIDVCKLPNGIYFIQLQTENKIITQKFIKQ